MLRYLTKVMGANVQISWLFMTAEEKARQKGVRGGVTEELGF